MKIIVGLGNPDKKYQNTFHNLGFMAVDKMAEKLGVVFSQEKFKSLVAETRLNGEKVFLLKPQTYMNLSGQAVREIVDFYKADLSDLVIIYDDFDIRKGAVRIRENGSAGTHNGMKSIVECLGSTNFPRIRIGFKQEADSPIPAIDYVLSGLTANDKVVLGEAITVASYAGIDFANGKKLDYVMQTYNRK